MWELTIKTDGYDKLVFEFGSMKELTEFAEKAVNHCDRDVVCSFRKIEETEGEEN